MGCTYEKTTTCFSERLGTRADCRAAGSRADCLRVDRRDSDGCDQRDDSHSQFDFSAARRTDINDTIDLGFRTGFFNLSDRAQFSPPNTQPGAAQFGQVTAQYNQP